jgi:hypothetical protein
MAASFKAWVLFGSLNKIHVYCKILRIIIPLHQLFTSSANHGVHLKCNSSAEHYAQRGRLLAVVYFCLKNARGGEVEK